MKKINIDQYQNLILFCKKNNNMLDSLFCHFYWLILKIVDKLCSLFLQNGVIHFNNDRTSNASVYNNVSRHHVADKSRQTEYTNVGKKYIVTGNGHNSNHLHNGQSHKVHYADNIGIISTKNSPPSSINELDKKKQREIERKRRRRICTVILLLLLALIIGFGVGLLVYFLLMNGENEIYLFIYFFFAYWH